MKVVKHLIDKFECDDIYVISSTMKIYLLAIIFMLGKISDCICGILYFAPKGS